MKDSSLPEFELSKRNLTKVRRDCPHSPLIPCPVPHWLQIADSIIPPQSLSSGRRKSSQKRTVDNGRTAIRMPSFERQSSIINTPLAPGRTDIATNRSSTGQSIKLGKAISSPKPTLPLTRPPYKGWPYSHHDQGSHHTSNDSGPPIRPLDSVADRLGSLVDRGWVGCDVFGKAYSNRLASDIYASSDHSQKAKPIERRSNRDKSLEEAWPARRVLYPEQGRTVRNDNEATMANEIHPSEGNDFKPMEHENCRKWRCETTLGSDSKAHTRIDSSEFDKSQASGSDKDISSNQIQGKTRGHHRYFMDCQSQHSDLEKLSLSQEIDRHLSQWENTRVIHCEHSSLAEVDPVSGPVDDHLHASSLAPDLIDHSHNAANMQQSKEQPSRSASWFSKLAGFKLVLIDKAPIMQVLSRRTSEPAIGSVGGQHHYRHQHYMKPQPAQTTDENTLSGSEYLIPKIEPKPILPKSDALKVLSETTAGYDSAMNVQTTEKPVDTPDSTLLQTGHSPSESHSYSSRVTKASNTHAHPSQKNGLDTISDEKPSKSSSLTRRLKEQSNPASCIASISRIAPISQEIRSASPNSEGIATGDIAGADDCKAPGDVLPRLKTAKIVHPIGEDANDTKKSTQWEVAGNGRGIKRVQVIVSLDGADDLMIDAKLLKTPKGNVECRIEEAEILDSENLGDSSSQDFF